VYLPNGRQNLASFVSVNSEATDKEGFGKIQILQLPSETQISGPNQIANDFQADKGVSQALLQYQQSKTVNILYGNLLTLPVGDGLLYVQPVYIKRTSDDGSYPVLQFVIASFGDGVGFGQNLDEALRVALGLDEASIPDDEGDAGDGNVDDQTKQTASSLLDRASRYYDQAEAALKEGDLATYQRRINQMSDAVADAKKLVDEAEKK
jgi:uncharacterized membrane protein (UPF0182 family)